MSQKIAIKNITATWERCWSAEDKTENIESLDRQGVILKKSSECNEIYMNNILTINKKFEKFYLKHLTNKLLLSCEIFLNFKT